MFFEEAARSALDVVTTVAWRFDVPDDSATIQSWLEPYVTGGRVLCVELVAPLAVRLERNRSEARRSQKNAYWVTDAYLTDMDAAHRYDSGGAFPLDLPHLRLETEQLDAEDVAERIMAYFDLPRKQDRSTAP